MTNGELFIRENPTVETKINGSCVWVYFDGVNHYTMPVSWWDKEIGLFDNIRAEIENEKYIGFTPQDFADGLDLALEIIDKYKAERSEE